MDKSPRYAKKEAPVLSDEELFALDELVDPTAKILVALKEDIENGLSNIKLKFVLNNGMDDLGINFRGRKTKISQYVDSKREEIEEIRLGHKRQRRMGEVINLFNCI